MKTAGNVHKDPARKGTTAAMTAEQSVIMDADYDRLSRSMIIATPFMLLVPVVFTLAFTLTGTDLNLAAAGTGAAGWLVALAFRAPVGLGLLRVLKAPERVQPWVVGSSGPLEEGVRLLALVLIGRSFSDAVFLGIGWAAIEVVYTVANSFLILNLIRRTDEEAVQAREILAAQGMLRTTRPALGVMERVGATALHIGFTLLVAWNGITAIATMIVHSAVNLTLTRTFRASALASEIALLVVGFTAITAGIALLG